MKVLKNKLIGSKNTTKRYNSNISDTLLKEKLNMTKAGSPIEMKHVLAKKTNIKMKISNNKNSDSVSKADTIKNAITWLIKQNINVKYINNNYILNGKFVTESKLMVFINRKRIDNKLPPFILDSE